MRKIVLLPLLASLLAMASCSGNTDPALPSDYEGDKMRIDRSGDLLVSSPSTYLTIGNGRDYTQMLKALDNGESVLFSFASYNCNHCHEFESTYITYIRENKAHIYGYYLENTTASEAEYLETFTAIGEYFGIANLNENPFRYTPTLWIASKEGYYSISSGNVSRQYLDNSFANYGDYSNLYYFSSFENYQKADSSGILTILYSQEASSEAFHESLYSLANLSGKTTYLIDYDTLSDEEKSSALSYFGLSEYSLSFSLNNETIEEKDALSYYGASS